MPKVMLLALLLAAVFSLILVDRARATCPAGDPTAAQMTDPWAQDLSAEITWNSLNDLPNDWFLTTASSPFPQSQGVNTVHHVFMTDRIYACTYNGYVYYVEPDGTIRQMTGQLGNTEGIASSTDGGEIYINDQTAQAVKKFTSGDTNLASATTVFSTSAEWGSLTREKDKLYGVSQAEGCIRVGTIGSALAAGQYACQCGNPGETDGTTSTCQLLEPIGFAWLTTARRAFGYAVQRNGKILKIAHASGSTTLHTYDVVNDRFDGGVLVHPENHDSFFLSRRTLSSNKMIYHVDGDPTTTFRGVINMGATDSWLCKAEVTNDFQSLTYSQRTGEIFTVSSRYLRRIRSLWTTTGARPALTAATPTAPADLDSQTSAGFNAAQEVSDVFFHQLTRVLYVCGPTGAWRLDTSDGDYTKAWETLVSGPLPARYTGTACVVSDSGKWLYVNGDVVVYRLDLTASLPGTLTVIVGTGVQVGMFAGNPPNGAPANTKDMKGSWRKMVYQNGRVYGTEHTCVRYYDEATNAVQQHVGSCISGSNVDGGRFTGSFFYGRGIALASRVSTRLTYVTQTSPYNIKVADTLLDMIYSLPAQHTRLLDSIVVDPSDPFKLYASCSESGCAHVVVQYTLSATQASDRYVGIIQYEGTLLPTYTTPLSTARQSAGRGITLNEATGELITGFAPVGALQGGFRVINRVFTPPSPPTPPPRRITPTLDAGEVATLDVDEYMDDNAAASSLYRIAIQPGSSPLKVWGVQLNGAVYFANVGGSSWTFASGGPAYSLAFDADGTYLYLGATGAIARIITSNYLLSRSVLVGDGTEGFVPGTSPNARVGTWRAIARVDEVLYGADSYNHCIMSYDITAASVAQFACKCGNGNAGQADGTFGTCTMDRPHGVAFANTTSLQNGYVVHYSQADGGLVRKLDAVWWLVTTVHSQPKLGLAVVRFQTVIPHPEQTDVLFVAGDASGLRSLTLLRYGQPVGAGVAIDTTQPLISGKWNAARTRGLTGTALLPDGYILALDSSSKKILRIGPIWTVLPTPSVSVTATATFSLTASLTAKETVTQSQVSTVSATPTATHVSTISSSTSLTHSTSTSMPTTPSASAEATPSSTPSGTLQHTVSPQPGGSLTHSSSFSQVKHHSTTHTNVVANGPKTSTPTAKLPPMMTTTTLTVRSPQPRVASKTVTIEGTTTQPTTQAPTTQTAQPTTQTPQPTTTPPPTPRPSGCVSLPVLSSAPRITTSSGDISKEAVRLAWNESDPSIVSRSAVVSATTSTSVVVPPSAYVLVFVRPTDRAPSDTGFEQFVDGNGHLNSNSSFVSLSVVPSTGVFTVTVGPLAGYSITAYEEDLQVWLRAGWFVNGADLCGVADVDSPAVLVATVRVEPPTNSFISGAAATAQVAGDAALVASAAGGGALAADLATVAILAEMDCARPSQREAGGNVLLISPLPLFDGVEGKLVGNMVIVTVFVLIHFLVTLAKENLRPDSRGLLFTQAMLRFPAASIAVAGVLHQGTMFLSFRLVAGGAAANAGGTVLGVFGLLYGLGAPAIVIFLCIRRIDSVFVTYDHMTATEARKTPMAYPLRVLLPRGRWEPREMRQAYGVMLSPFEKESPLWFLFAFMSPSIIGAAAAPESGDKSACVRQYATIAALQALYIVALIVFRPYRSAFANIITTFSSATVFLVALASTLVLEHPDSDAPVQIAATAILIQGVVTLIRIGYALFTVVCEARLTQGVFLRATLRRCPQKHPWDYKVSKSRVPLNNNTNFSNFALTGDEKEYLDPMLGATDDVVVDSVPFPSQSLRNDPSSAYELKELVSPVKLERLTPSPLTVHATDPTAPLKPAALVDDDPLFGPGSPRAASGPADDPFSFPPAPQQASSTHSLLHATSSAADVRQPHPAPNNTSSSSSFSSGQVLPAATRRVDDPFDEFDDLL